MVPLDSATAAQLKNEAGLGQQIHSVVLPAGGEDQNKHTGWVDREIVEEISFLPAREKKQNNSETFHSSQTRSRRVS